MVESNIYLFLIRTLSPNSDANAAVIRAKNEQEAFDQIMLNHPHLFSRRNVPIKLTDWEGTFTNNNLIDITEGYYHWMNLSVGSECISIKKIDFDHNYSNMNTTNDSTKVIWDH